MNQFELETKIEGLKKAIVEHEEMRIFDCGYAKGLQNALSKIQEYGE